MIKMIILCLMTCCSSIASLKENNFSITNVDQTQVIEIKNKKNYVISNTGFYQYGLSDLFSYDFANAIISYFGVNLGNANLLLNSDNTGQYVLQTADTYKVFWFDNNNHDYVFAFNVSNIILDKSTWNNTSRKTFIYRLTFSNSSPYDKTVSVCYYTQRSNDNQLTILGVYLEISSALSSSIGTVNTWFTRFMLSEDSSSRTAFIYDLANKSHSDNYNAGFENGYNNGYADGYDSVVNNSQSTGYQSIYNNGFQNGYTSGYSEALDTDSTALTIFTGFVNVGLLPVNVFLQMFNYEVFGINIAGLLTSIITIAIVVIIIRVITGKKND